MCACACTDGWMGEILNIVPEGDFFSRTRGGNIAAEIQLVLSRASNYANRVES